MCLDFIEVYDSGITRINSYAGGPFQQALSGLTNLNNKWYNGKEYAQYRFYYTPGLEARRSRCRPQWQRWPKNHSTGAYGDGHEFRHVYRFLSYKLHWHCIDASSYNALRLRPDISKIERCQYDLRPRRLPNYTIHQEPHGGLHKPK